MDRSLWVDQIVQPSYNYLIVENRLLTTRQAAALLAVGPTSVKRWADSGILPCVKTAGGHRRFELHVVGQFKREHISPAVANDDDVAEFVNLLVTGQSLHQVKARLLDERGTRGSWWRVADMIGSVLTEIGRRWAEGRLTVVEEHLATERLRRAVTYFSDQIPVMTTAPSLLLAAASNDEHTLGLALVELCAREIGWRTTWVGQTPVDDLVEFLERGGHRAVAISASSWSSDPADLRKMETRMAKVCRTHGVTPIYGGSGAWNDQPELGFRVHHFEAFRTLLDTLLEGDADRRR